MNGLSDILSDADGGAGATQDASAAGAPEGTPGGGAPGWYGKLPSLGDFAARRLSHELIEAWDAWLAEELGGLRQQWPDNWLEGYLQSPTWRFVLSAGTLGTAQPWPLAGILMPSVDRVGRYFPLTIAAPLSSLPHSHAQAEALLNWLHAMDDLAADAMEEDWPIETLDQALARQPAPTWADDVPPLAHALASLASGETRLVQLPLPETRHAMAEGLGRALWHWGLDGLLSRSLSPGLAWWWAEPPDPAQPSQTLLSRGLPSGADFEALMGPQRHTGPSCGDFAPADLGDTAAPAPSPVTTPFDPR